MKPIYSHICAVAENNTIGLKGKLPWRIPEDLQFFYKKTKGKVLIMGRKTFESLSSPLPHRLHLVLTRQKTFQAKLSFFNYIPLWSGGLAHIQGGSADPLRSLKKSLSVVICPSLKEALDFSAQPELIKKHGPEIFITGGEEIYRQSLPIVQRVYLTRIHKSYKGDTFYPKLPEDMFQESKRTDRPGSPSYSFITYEKVRNKGL